MAAGCVREEADVRLREAKIGSDKPSAVCRLTPSVLASLSCSSPSLRSENRISISTDASEPPLPPPSKPRRKAWPFIKPAEAQRHYRPMSLAKVEELRGLALRLEDLYSALDEEIEAFSIRECTPKLRECTLAQAPIGSSLLRRRGLKPAPSV